MSNFEVPVCRLSVSPHPNADRLQIGTVGGYRFIVGLDRRDGDLGAYIPEGSILPESLIEEMGARDYLAGKEKNRVKATRLRGELSQGLWYPFTDETLRGNGVCEGDNVAEWLGIEKWEPPIPVQLQGKVRAVGPERPFWWAYDLEDIKKYPELIAEGEEVQFTEKLHGTLLFLAILEGETIVSSKGLASRRLSLERDDANTYWRAVGQHRLEERLRRYMEDRDMPNAILFGEILGVQDLLYGMDKQKGEIAFRAFDLLTPFGFLTPMQFAAACGQYDIPRVPIVYQGAYSHATLVEHTSGQSTLATHLREGVVVKPLVERSDAKIGRVALKSVSGAYLTRKGEVTEYA